MNMKSLVAIGILVLVWPCQSIAQTRPEPKSLSLTVRLQSAYNPGVKLCVPIAINDSLKITWEKGLVQSSISALLNPKSESGAYTLKFELKEGMLDTVAYDVKAEPDLELEKPHKLTFTKYSGFELGYDHTLLLSNEACK